MSDKPAQNGSASVSIAIIGAGVVGLSIAFHLLERGAGSVTIFDRVGVGAGASGVQPGGVRQQWSTELNCRMAREAYGFYSNFAERVPATAQARLEPCGYLFVADDQSTVEQFATNIALQQTMGIPSRLLDSRQAADVAPALNSDAFLAAAYCAEDGYFDRPQSVIEAFAQAVVARGAVIELADVRSIERNGEGWKLLGAENARGSFDCVVVAAGYDSPELVLGLGIDLPISKRPRYLFFSEPIRERLLDPLVIGVDRGIAVKQLANGRVLASDLRAGEDPTRGETSWRQHIRANILDLLPLLEFVPFPLLVEGFYDMTPDALPIVDPLDGAGVWVAAGFSGHGFMVAPVIGRLVADGLLQKELPAWSSQLRLERLGEGAEVETQVI